MCRPQRDNVGLHIAEQFGGGGHALQFELAERDIFGRYGQHTEAREMGRDAAIDRQQRHGFGFQDGVGRG